MYTTLFDFAALVDPKDWELAWGGDEAAKKRIAEALDGVDLYFHAGPALEGCIWVSIVDLLTHGIIERVTLHKD